MKMFLVIGLILATSAATQADIIHLNNKKNVTGRVLSYANMTFEVEDEAGKITRHSTSSITSIEFDKEGAFTSMEIRNQDKKNFVVTSFEKGEFSGTNDDGKVEKIASLLVVRADFGGNYKKVEQISGNDLTKYLAKGKITIVDFYADWCGPCRSIGPFLEELAKKDSDVVLRKANVDKCQALAQKYAVKGIPHIMIFDKTGKNIGTVVGANRDGVTQYVNQAKKKT